MPQIKAEQTIDISVNNFDLSNLLLEWIKENTPGTSNSHLDYFVSEEKLYQGENNRWMNDEAVFITEDKRIISIFESAKHLRSLK